MNYRSALSFLLIILLMFSSCAAQGSVFIDITGLDTYQIISNNPASGDAQEANILVDVVKDQQKISFASENFYIRLNLKSDISAEDLHEKIKMNPVMSYRLANLADVGSGLSKQWGILPLDWNVGDKAAVRVQGKDKDYNFELQKVEPPRIVEYQLVTPVERKTPSLNSNSIESNCLLDNTKVIIKFSKPMNKNSVTSIIGRSVSQAQSYKVGCSWESATSLVMQFSNNTDKIAEVSISLTGAKDCEGVSLLDSNGLKFHLYKGEIIYQYNSNSKIQYELTSNYNFGEIAMSGDSLFIACTDVIKNYTASDVPGDSYDVVNLNLIELPKGRTRLLSTIKIPKNYNSKIVWSDKNYFFYYDTIYDVLGRKILVLTEVLNAGFSPDERAIAVVQYNNLGSLILAIYKLKTGEVLFEQVLSDSDQGIADHISYRVAFLNDNTVLLERDSKIWKFNIDTLDIREITKGTLGAASPNNYLSPDKLRCLIIKDEWMVIWNLIDGWEYVIPSKNPCYTRWMADSSKLAYITMEDKRIRVVAIENNSSEIISATGIPLGWNSKGDMIFYN